MNRPGYLWWLGLGRNATLNQVCLPGSLAACGPLVESRVNEVDQNVSNSCALSPVLDSDLGSGC